MVGATNLLMVQFLDWVTRRPRRYVDLRAAWSSTCPLTCAWEDAVADDLVCYGPDGALALTAQGRAQLAAAGEAAMPGRGLDRANRESMVPPAVRQFACPSRGDRP